MASLSLGGSAPSQPAPPSAPKSNTRLGVSAPVSVALPTVDQLRLARELEECLHTNNLYESKSGKQLRETVSFTCSECTLIYTLQSTDMFILLDRF